MIGNNECIHGLRKYFIVIRFEKQWLEIIVG